MGVWLKNRFFTRRIGETDAQLGERVQRESRMYALRSFLIKLRVSKR